MTAREFDGYVFICGLHRSGTTLAEALLQARCDVSVLRADVSENEGQHLQDVYPRAIDNGGPGKFAFAANMHANAASDPAAARDRLLKCWTPWVQGEARVLLEKSPPNLTRIGWLRSVFPGARFLIVVRDPRAVAMATQKWTRMSVPEMMYHWHVAHGAALDAQGDDCATLRYEDLCDDPDRAISQSVRVLGLTERKNALPVADRFQSIENTNAQYLEDLKGYRFGRGAWDKFGYDID